MTLTNLPYSEPFRTIGQTDCLETNGHIGQVHTIHVDIPIVLAYNEFIRYDIDARSLGPRFPVNIVLEGIDRYPIIDDIGDRVFNQCGTIA